MPGHISKQEPDTNCLPTSMELLENLTEEEWKDVGRNVAAQAESDAWWVGDWLVYGKKAFGKERACMMAMEATGYAKDTLYAYARVAERVPTCNRITGLGWAHHREVENLRPDQQLPFLTEAKANRYTVERLRMLVYQAEQCR